ncbi:MAG: phosphatase PAP2 family protein [Tannerella sp.]|jgi:undecaprenyl-diphosphatase|nr:phosphatase PAP2 family protein [Tannerella sp.]
MLDSLVALERDAFLWLNGFHTPFMDEFMWLFSGKIAWLPLAAVFIGALIYKNRSQWREIVLLMLAIALAATLCDQFASSLCKPLFTRFRPTHHPDVMNDVITVFGYRGGRYGFISSHAANAFGFVTLTSLIFRYRAYTLWMFVWASITAYSRIYLGVHFITDIIPGILAGLLFGYLVYRLYIIVSRKFSQPSSHQFLHSRLNYVLYALLATVIVIAVISITLSTT